MEKITLHNTEGKPHVTTRSAWEHEPERDRLIKRGFNIRVQPKKETQVLLNDKEGEEKKKK